MFAQVTLVGNLGGDPEMSYIQSGSAVTKFSVAINRTREGEDGEKQKETDWWNIVAWGRLGETCNQFLQKGAPVLVLGYPRLRKWSGQDGTEHQRLEVVASTVRFLGRNKRDAEPASQEAGGGPEPTEELPF